MVGDRLEQEYPDTLRRLAAPGDAAGKLWLIVAGEQSRRRTSLDAAAAERPTAPFPPAPTDTIWMRDFGPVFISDAKGRRSVVDLEYSLPQRDGQRRHGERCIRRARPWFVCRFSWKAATS